MVAWIEIHKYLAGNNDIRGCAYLYNFNAHRRAKEIRSEIGPTNSL